MSCVQGCLQLETLLHRRAIFMHACCAILLKAVADKQLLPILAGII